MNFCAGLIYDDSRHYIDHLAPFCALMGWPLIICESAIADLARTYYPTLEVVEANLWDLDLPRNLVTCTPILPVDGRNVFWLPHGNSDKEVFMKGQLQKEIALVYGQRMIDFMAANGVHPTYIRIGNFRRHYYLQHQKFYDSLLHSEKKTILYTPTWDESNSLWETLPYIADFLDDRHHLIIKIHPNTAIKFAPKIEALKGRYEKENVVFLDDFPPIYPLLNIADLYIGDMSSIGYDFLSFNRPMFFLNPGKHAAPLFSCGQEVTPEQIGRWIHDEQLHLAPRRQKIYESTFDPAESWESACKAIKMSLL